MSGSNILTAAVASSVRRPWNHETNLLTQLQSTSTLMENEFLIYCPAISPSLLYKLSSRKWNNFLELRINELVAVFFLMICKWKIQVTSCNNFFNSYRRLNFKVKNNCYKSRLPFPKLIESNDHTTSQKLFFMFIGIPLLFYKSHSGLLFPKLEFQQKSVEKWEPSQ